MSKISDADVLALKRYQHIKERAEKEGVGFDLPFAVFKDAITSGVCGSQSRYSLTRHRKIARRGSGQRRRGMTIDRVRGHEMSNRAHRGRCFRSNRATAIRKARQGTVYKSHPTRWKVPFAIRPFLTGEKNQSRAMHDQMGQAIARYAAWQTKTGKGAPVRPAGARRGG